MIRTRTDKGFVVKPTDSQLSFHIVCPLRSCARDNDVRSIKVHALLLDGGRIEVVRLALRLLVLKNAVEVKGGVASPASAGGLRWRFPHGSSGSAERKGRLQSDEGREQSPDEAVSAQGIRDDQLAPLLRGQLRQLG